MRSIWIYLSSAAVLIVIGGTFYHFIPTPSLDLALPSSELQVPLAEPRVLVLPAGNPLLTADALRLDMWIPSYPIPCGEIVLGAGDARARNFSFCLGEIRNRVARHTRQKLSDEDVLDPRVRAHWRATARRR